MRTINATLLTNQKFLGGRPCLSLVIGTPANTIDISAYVLGYRYEEASRESGLTIYLDNHSGYFNTLSGDKAYIKHGATVEFKRGLTVTGTDYVEELPRTWIETQVYNQAGGQSIYTLECIDWRGKLARWRAASEQNWSNTSITTILEWILTQVSLTRLAGSMTALSIDFDIRLHETGHGAIKRLLKKIPEYLLPGLDAEIKWREIDSADASVYTFGWNAEHPVLNVEAGTSAWAINSITVNGRGSYTGTASDATQITNVGTRKLTIYDYELKSNANCAQRAQAELDLYEAEAIEAVIICRPCHGLELYDVVKIDNPPWGGADVTGRVIRWSEQRDQDGRWYQVITLGNAPDKSPGKQPAKRKRSRRRSRRNRSTYGGILRRLRIVEDFIEWLRELLFGDEFSLGFCGVGQITGWHGAIADIPIGWALCDGTNGTPDLRNRFLVGAGDTYNPGDTGGADTIDIRHRHGNGSLAAANDTHGHDVTGSSGDVNFGSASNTDGTGGITTYGLHTHGDGSYAAANDTHGHDVTGNTAYTLSTTQSILPTYYALALIMRIF